MNHAVCTFLLTLLFAIADVRAGEVLELPDEVKLQEEIDDLVDTTPDISPKDMKAASELIEQGVKQYERGRYEAAKKLFQKALKKDPLNTLAYYELAMTQYTLRELADCYANSVRASLLNPQYEEPYIMKASTLDDAGYPDRAEQELKRLLQINPDSLMAWVNLGVIYFKEKKHEPAEAAMLQAVKLDADYPVAYFYLTALASLNGHNYEEEKYAKRFLELAGDDPRRKLIEERLAEITKKTVYLEEGREVTRLYVLQQITRMKWRTEKHRAAYPGEAGYRPSLQEESEVVQVSLAYAVKLGAQLNDDEKHEIEFLRELEKLGYLDARNYVELESYLGQQDLKWGEQHADEIRRYRQWLKKKKVH